MNEQEKAQARKAAEEKHGQVWDTNELQAEFSVQGFSMGYVVVKRKSDGKLGSMEFDHMPRFYYNFVED